MNRFPAHGRPILRRFDDEEVGVSDVVGSILMVGITVVMATALGFLILAFKGPPAVANVNLSVTLDPGQFGWGTGDESIKVAHLGGDPLPRDSSRITYTINGVATTLSGTNLGSMFADGKLTVGEVWVRAQPLAASDAVTVNVVAGGGQQALVAATQLIPSTLGGGPNCILDNVPPTALSWLQTPADVRTTTSGAIDITVTLTDGCKGVSSTPPELWYRIWDGVSATAYTKVTTAITQPGTNQWKGTVPAGLDFAHSGAKIFQYQFQQVSDGSNVGTVQGPDDTIDVITTFAYMVCPFTGVSGALSNCNGATNNVITDFATIQEVASSATSSATILAGATTTGSTGIVNGAGCSAGATCATGNDASYARLDGSTDVLAVGGFTAPAGATGITNIKVGWVAHKAISTDSTPVVRLLYTGVGTDPSPVLSNTAGCPALSSTSDVTCEADVTADRAWTVANIASLSVQADGVGGNIAGSRRADVDVLYVKVTYTFNQYSLASTAGFGPALTDGPGGNRILDVQASVTGTAGFDSVNVQVCTNPPTCTTWATKMTFTTSSMTAFTSASLTTTEWNAGSPKVRVIDATSTSTVQTTISIDYIRVNLS